MFLLFVLTGSAGAQENTKDDEVKTQLIAVKPIGISDISTESEKLAKRISKLKSSLKSSPEIREVDSLIYKTSEKVTIRRDSLYLKIDNMSQRRLKIRSIEWANYKSDLKDYQNILNARLDEVTSINKELVTEHSRWELTKANFADNKESVKISNNIDTVLSILDNVIKISMVRLDSIFIIQKNLTNFILSVDEVIADINKVSLQLQKDYFVFDSPALWEFGKIHALATDTSAIAATNSYTTVSTRVNENLKTLIGYLDKNLKSFIFQIGFLLLLLILMFVIKRKWEKEPTEITSTVEKEANIVLQHPFASTFVVGILTSAFFYKTLIPIFAEIHILLILTATVIILPKFTTPRFVTFLLLLLSVYVLQSIDVYLNAHSLFFRITLFFDSTILVVALIMGRMETRKNPKQFMHIRGLFNFIVPVYILLLIIGFVANIIGMVSLSNFIVSGILSSTALGIVVFVSVKVTTSFFILLFKLRDSAHTHALATMVKVTQKRIKPILLFVGLVLWIIFTLKSFEVYNHLLNYIGEVLLINWQVGEMTISLGGILSFIGIFLLAIMLAKLAAAIFHDDWMVNVLPRGVAPAISLILRIFIISIGLYVSLSAAGLDLGKLGFIVGALGVGIGFGLQNVVLNFIAGLILAFERPINLGDTIEIDQEKGVVTNIGVRSSNIRTYSGSEAIIPNGDLISKKVVNWTLANRDRRSKILMKTSADADPEKVIGLLNRVALEHPSVFNKPKPYTLFYGYNEEGNLDFELYYWTTFNQTLDVDHDIALAIFKQLKEEGINAPVPVRRIITERIQKG